MTIQILMPALSPTMTEGKLAKWHVKEGDAVKSGQVLCEIETDKATMEVEAVDEGVIGKILIAEGAEGVAVNTPIAILLEEGEDKSSIKAAAAAAVPKPTSAPPQAPQPMPAPANPPVAAAKTQTTPVPTFQSKSLSSGRVFASPLARRIAGQNGIDVALLKGSGPHGRVVRADIDAALKSGSGKAQSSIPSAAFGASRASKLVPHTGVRKVIARRLTEAKQHIPHIYVTIDCVIDALLEARKQINAKSDKIKVSVNDMIVKASALALRDHPDVNASWTDEGTLIHGTIDVSVAVASDRGLFTPILRDADLKGLGALSSEMRELAARAKDGKLKLEEFQGGGFTVSNLGMFGVKEFAAIINPPQAAILAVGAGGQRAIVVEGAIKIATVMSVTLAADHRIVDGALAAIWLRSFQGYIEQPATMLI